MGKRESHDLVLRRSGLLNMTVRSTIRLTVENVSMIPIEFLKVTCVDSTMAPAQQALADGDMPVFETYETEYELLRRPVFRWDRETEPKAVSPGRKAVLTIVCSGKVGWYVSLFASGRRSLCLGCPTAQAERSKYPIPTSNRRILVRQMFSIHGKSCIPFSSRCTTRLNVTVWTSCLSLQ